MILLTWEGTITAGVVGAATSVPDVINMLIGSMTTEIKEPAMTKTKQTKGEGL